MENEPAKFKAFNLDASIITGCYVDLSQLTPQQIAVQENLGKIPDEPVKFKTDYIEASKIKAWENDGIIPDGDQYFKDGDIKGNLLDFWNINTLKEK